MQGNKLRRPQLAQANPGITIPGTNQEEDAQSQDLTNAEEKRRRFSGQTIEKELVEDRHTKKCLMGPKQTRRLQVEELHSARKP